MKPDHLITAAAPLALEVRAPDGPMHEARLYLPDDGRAERQAPRTCMLFAHGAGAGQSHPFMVRYARGLAARGMAVVTFDFPYMQARRRAPDRAAVLEETFRRVAVAAAQHSAVAGAPLVLAGKSMGGRMATHVAASNEMWPSGVRLPVAVVVFGYPLHPPGGASGRSADRVSHLARVQMPLLIVQGTRDSFGGPDLIAQAAPHARVVPILGGDHSLAVSKSAGTTQAATDGFILDEVSRFVMDATAGATPGHGA